MMLRANLSLIAASAAGAGAPAPSRRRPAAAAAAPALDSRAVVAEVRRIIAERYVLPERRPALDAILARGLASGRYDVREPAALAERINADLDTAGHDRHLNFNYNPAPGGDPRRGTAGRSPTTSALRTRRSRAANHGVSELRVLPGNVRYLAYDGFMWIGPESAAALDTAMRFLAGGDAVIIDLRRNGGGSPDAVQYLVSHFLPAERPLVTFYMNGQPEPDRLSTLAEAPGRPDGRQAALRADQQRHRLGRRGVYRPCRRLPDRRAGRRDHRRRRLPQRAGADRRPVRAQRLGRPGGARLDRPRLGGGRPRADGPDPDRRRARRRSRPGAAPPRRRRPKDRSGPGSKRPPKGSPPAASAAARRCRSPPMPAPMASARSSLEDGRLWVRRGQRAPIALIPLGGNAFAYDSDPAIRLEFQVAGERATAFAVGGPGAPPQGPFARTA